MNYKQYFPILSWFPFYKKEDFRSDLVAGLTVGVMLIPQGMAYAMLAGLPPIYGLYASIVPLILYAVFGTSRQLAVGPVAMVSLLILAGVGTLSPAGSEEFIALAILLAFMVGFIQLAMGIFKLGFLVNFLSHPVIAGFTSAAALIIGFSQLKHLMGTNIPRSNHVHEIIIHALSTLDQINWPTLLVGVTAIILLVLIKKIKLPVPGPLLVVAGSIIAVWSLGLYNQGVKIVGTVPEGLPSFSVPAIGLESMKNLLPIALTIAFIGFMESIAVAKAIQSRHKNYKVVPNQELIALGLANIGGSFFQSFPTTGGFSRTAVNDQSGAKTGLSSIFSALLIALTLLFLTPLFYYLPQAILASIIMVAVFGLINFKEAKHLWHADRGDFWMMMVTFIATLFLGIEEGILTGVILSLGLIIYRTTQPHFAVMGKIPDKPHYKNINRFNHLEIREDVLIIRFDARLYFANATFFKEMFEKEMDKKGKKLKAIIFDANSMNGIDSSGLTALEEVIGDCQLRNIQFFITGLKGPARDILYRCGLTEKLGKDHFHFCIQHAVDYIDDIKTPHYHNYTSQIND